MFLKFPLKGECKMILPEMKCFVNEQECKQYYVDHYCNGDAILTYDGIVVKFYEETFEHSFYVRTHKNWKAKKDKYDEERGKRIDWIKAVLQNPEIIPKKGYDKANKSYDNSRRVTFLAPNNYVVVIYLNKKLEGKFVTAYLVDNEDTAKKISDSPEWEM